jgi:hypothetical protein
VDALMPLQQENNWNDYFSGNNYIMAGLGIKPASTPRMVEIVGHDKEAYNNLHELFLKDRQQIEDYVKTLPTHYEFLKENIYSGKDEYDD